MTWNSLPSTVLNVWHTKTTLLQPQCMSGNSHSDFGKGFRHILHNHLRDLCSFLWYIDISMESNMWPELHVTLILMGQLTVLSRRSNNWWRQPGLMKEVYKNSRAIFSWCITIHITSESPSALIIGKPLNTCLGLFRPKLRRKAEKEYQKMFEKKLSISTSVRHRWTSASM